MKTTTFSITPVLFNIGTYVKKIRLRKIGQLYTKCTGCFGIFLRLSKCQIWPKFTFILAVWIQSKLYLGWYYCSCVKTKTASKGSNITPIMKMFAFFSIIGINEKATLGHKMGQNGPQEKNNIDNFKTLAEYYRRYNKLNLDQGSQRNKRK